MIQNWLDNFFKYWKTYNIDAVIGLFEDRVEYWETPYKKIESTTELEEEWRHILSQRNIEISYKILSESENGYTVLWNLEYIDSQDRPRKYAGLYFLKLNANGLCSYFVQCGQESS